LAVPVSFRVNGREVHVEVEPRALLVDVLRGELGLTGTHVGCDTSQCGACTVLIDGKAVKSCTVLAVQVDGAEVVTVEGLAELVPPERRVDGMHPIQAAFWEKHGLQCGFCTPGMLMTAVDLLAANPSPADDEIRRGLEGNYCRCTGYQNIVAAIRRASELMATKGGER